MQNQVQVLPAREALLSVAHATVSRVSSRFNMAARLNTALGMDRKVVARMQLRQFDDFKANALKSASENAERAVELTITDPAWATRYAEGGMHQGYKKWLLEGPEAAYLEGRSAFANSLHHLVEGTIIDVVSGEDEEFNPMLVTWLRGQFSATVAFSADNFQVAKAKLQRTHGPRDDASVHSFIRGTCEMADECDQLVMPLGSHQSSVSDLVRVRDALEPLRTATANESSFVRSSLLVKKNLDRFRDLQDAEDRLSEAWAQELASPDGKVLLATLKVQDQIESDQLHEQIQAVQNYAREFGRVVRTERLALRSQGLD